MIKKTIFIIILLVCYENSLASPNKDFKNLYTLVNGMLLSPSATAHTIGKNTLRTGFSGYYYKYKENQNSILYFPKETHRGEDAFIVLTVEYGIFNNSEVSILIPHSPDWYPNRGGNKQGIADVAILFKQYLLTKHDISMGLIACYKLNTSAFADEPRWYGTNNSNIILKVVFSAMYQKLSPFINIGYKNVLGSDRIISNDYKIDFTYSNTYIGAIGVNYQLLKSFDISLESNFESHNKKGMSGYYLDICGGFNYNLIKNINCYGKLGQNISNFAPNLYISTGISVATKL